MPQASIIVPACNAQDSIERCIESILVQDMADFEVILVDDGSTDHTAALCDEFAQRDGRIHVIHKDNAGVSNARNAALALAQGTWIQFADADDWLAPEATRLMIEAAETHNCEMVISDYYRVVGERAARKSSIEADMPLSRKEFADYMLEDPADYYYGVLWNKLFRRDIVEAHALGFDPTMAWCEDFIFNMEYLLYVHHIYPLHVPVYYYVKTAGSLVAQGMNVADIVRMKLSVVEYYRSFYRKILDPHEYQQRRIEINRFLVDVAGDDGAIPLLPNTKKLGEERLSIYDFPAHSSTPLTQLYYAGRLLDHYLALAGMQYDLELRDVKLLAFIKQSGPVGSLKELADCSRMSQANVVAALQRLARKQLISMDSDTLLSDLGEAALSTAFGSDDTDRKLAMHLELTEAATPIARAIDKAYAEYTEACTADMSESERTQYEQVENRAASNIRAALQR